MTVAAQYIYQPNQVIKYDEPSADSSFKTHLFAAFEILHTLSETILLPARYALQSLAHVIEPMPGQNKEEVWCGVAIRAGSLALGILSLPFALLSLVIGLPLRWIDHLGRKEISYFEGIKNPPELPLVDQEHPLKIRTHNLGLVPTTMSIVNDLRNPLERAQDIVKSILDDPMKPDLIFFEEVFHEDATNTLFEGLKEEYPYILYNLAPQITGFTSGKMVLSKYPIRDIEFRVFDHMIGPEKASARGMLRVSIESAQGKMYLYQTHTQALLGEERSQARSKQLQDIAAFMQSDAANCRGQVLVGDLNTSVVSAWGHDNRTQSERTSLNTFNELFDDPFLIDHNEMGARINGNPYYLVVDNESMQVRLPEPSGSWYVGPYYDPGAILLEKMRKDRETYGYPEPVRIADLPLEFPPSWGTTRWHSSQPANTARFDYILFSKNDKRLEARVEIRRVRLNQTAESAPSDHLPVDGRIWFRTE